ncbi:DUF2480 family protein [Luteibaculum oceani]|nr:DUF2480 family protein [Luteibaculum oceani]
MEPIINRVANSKLITLDLDEFIPSESITAIPIAEGLYEGLILKEKDFRNWVNQLVSKYQDQVLTIIDTKDAIVPKWAYLLLSTALSSKGNTIYFSDKEKALERLILDKVNSQFASSLAERSMVIIKGCGKLDLSGEFYGELAKLLRPKCKSLMFGEPCSTVPIYKA